jgi:hypothetical protein
VAAALEGDGLDVREDAIAEAERRQSGGFLAAKADPFAALEKLVSGAQAPVQAADRDQPSDAELDVSELELAPDSSDEPVVDDAHSSAAETVPIPELVALPPLAAPELGLQPDVEPDVPELASESVLTALEAPEASALVESSSRELKVPAEIEVPEFLDEDFDDLDEIEVGEFEDDEDVEFEDIEEGEFEDIDDSEFVDLDTPDSLELEEEPEDRSEDAAFAAAARANDIDAPIGRASSSVNQTFSPGDGVVLDDGGTGVGEAIAMRRSGAGMAAMFQLQEAELGPYPLAAGFELALANIEMGLYFEGISALEQLLGNMELERSDRLLVHYHLGIAYEAMDQQPLAEANFRVVAASAPASFPDVYIRLERLVAED